MESNKRILNVATKKIMAHLDIGLLVEISPNLQNIELVITREFLRSLVGSFDFGKNKQNIRLVGD